MLGLKIVIPVVEVLETWDDFKHCAVLKLVHARGLLSSSLSGWSNCTGSLER